jgi:AbrB family looped-hinge helix DNA binding protein
MRAIVRKVASIGGCRVVTLPKELMEQLGLELGDYVLLRPQGDGILLKPIREAKEP